MRTIKQAGIFIGLLAGFSCKTTRQESEIKHTLGEVSWSEGQWAYLNLDRPSFINMNSSNYLPETHPLSIKAQEWVRQLHEAVLNKFPDKMRDIPTPQIIVIKKDSPDAFAARRRTVSYQMKTGFTLTGPNSNDPIAETRPLYFSKPNMLSHNIFPVETTVQVEDQESFSKWFSTKFAPCSIEAVNQGEVRWSYGPGCERESYLKTNHWSEAFVTHLAPNWVIITSGLFSALPNEESFAAVIAHELAHYYRAHVVNNEKDHYSYCYMLNDPEHKPVEREELKTLCQDLKRNRSRAGMSPQDAAAKVGLGVYTYEQEADELALEFLSLIGIDPIRATDAWFALFAQSVADNSGSSVPIERCRELFARQWKQEDGSHVTIPIGDYRDPHHSWCYRIFNTTQEISAHGYRVEKPMRFDEKAWQALQAMGKNP